MRPGEGTQQPRAVRHAFKVRGDHPGVRIASHVVDAIGHRDIRLVPRGDPFGNADATLVRGRQQVGGDRPALADDGEAPLPARATGRLREGRCRAGMNIEGAHAVRAEQTHTRAPRRLRKPGLQRRAFRTILPKARGEQDRCLNPPLRTVLKPGQHTRFR